MRVLNRKLRRDLWRMKGQVLAISAVIGGGVALLVMMLGLLQSLDATRAAYYERHRFADIFSEVKRAPETLASRIAEIEGVQAVETRVIADVTLDIAEMAEPAIGRLISLPGHGEPVLNRLAIRQGRTLAPNAPFQAIVSEAFAEAHDLRPGDTITAILNQRKRDFQVVGVALSPEYIYSLGPGALFPDDRTFGVLWVPRETLAAAFDLDEAFNSVALTLLRGANEEAVIGELDRLLDTYGGLGAYSREDQVSHWFLDNELQQMWTMAAIVPPVFLAVAAFLLNVAIARLIELEREQIGQLKAFGFTDFEVGWHYAKMVLVIALLGAALGSGLGWWMGRGMTEMYQQFFRFPFLYYRPSPSVLAAGALVAVAAALLGAWTAVRRAVRLPPAEAMRPAPPPRYRRGVLDRAGVTAWITQTTRIILRHIVRWPLRAGLTVVGIAAGVMMMIASMFSVGAIDYMLEVQFFQAQRQDATVMLVEPRQEGALAEIARLPGVTAAEPFRAVQARLHGPRGEERMAITGLDAEPEIFRLLDAELEPLAVPPSGLLLSQALAERLGVSRGEELRVEVLEGRRPTIFIRVSAVSEEYMGDSAVMERRALSALMQEAPAISGAYVRVDGAALDRLYAQLQETPAVARISLKSTMLDSFRSHVAENLYQMIFVNGLFAGMIAFGVVYNAARIMLSERARELASLRVLGFTRFEVGYILLGELAILTFVALPLGCLMGYGMAVYLADAFETELYRIPLVLEGWTYGLAVSVVTVAAMLSGVIVARQIRHLDLVSVLKTRE